MQGVQGAQEKGISIRLAQSDLERLRVVQRMLARLGIIATIYADRRPAQTRSLPDGKGGPQGVPHRRAARTRHRQRECWRYAELIGFADTEKRAKLEFALGNYRRRPNRERFLAVVDTVKPAGEEEVFDVRVPGVNAFDANGFMSTIAASSRCRPYGACLLGSINLARLVERPFEADAALDLDELRALTAVAVRMMDNVTDISNFPLEEQRAGGAGQAAHRAGRDGLADALIMCRARYGSAAAVRLAEQWLAAIRKAAYLASADLAAEKGPFPLFDAEKYLATPAMADADEDVRAAVRDKGLRNALLTSIAPTGTISLLADNVSSGVEPVFTWSYTRNVLMPDGTRREEEVADYAWRLYRRLKGADAPLPDWFVDAGNLSPRDHVVMQAAVQKHVDSSISRPSTAPRYRLRRLQGRLRHGVRHGLQGLHDLPAERRHRRGADRRRRAKRTHPGSRNCRSPRRRRPRRPSRRRSGRRGVVYMTKPLDRPEALPGRTTRSAGGERPRHLHHAQTTSCRTAAAGPSNLHQLEEYRALRLDGRPDPHDQRRVSGAAATSPSWSRS